MQGFCQLDIPGVLLVMVDMKLSSKIWAPCRWSHNAPMRPPGVGLGCLVPWREFWSLHIDQPPSTSQCDAVGTKGHGANSLREACTPTLGRVHTALPPPSPARCEVPHAASEGDALGFDSAGDPLCGSSEALTPEALGWGEKWWERRYAFLGSEQWSKPGIKEVSVKWTEL
uniref:Uncharacterized protein n=1 Tax=Timema shepardi TaxID=629360 RepID=A0A7R9ASC0_TIMSH|nr:unnamed protein product [Timema shepardi]